MIGHYFFICKKHNIDKLYTIGQKTGLHNVSKVGQVYVTKQSNVTLSKKSVHIQSDNQNVVVNTVEELVKSSAAGKEGSLSLDGVPSLEWFG